MIIISVTYDFTTKSGGIWCARFIKFLWVRGCSMSVSDSNFPEAASSHTSTHRHEVSEGQRCGRGRTRYVLSGLLVVLRGVATPYGWQLWDYYQTHESTDDAYVVGDIVPMSAQVNGTVLAVSVVDNQTVEAHALLVQLDLRDCEARVKQAEATVAVAAANVRWAEIEVRLTQESTSTDTQRTSATLRGAQ